MNKKTAVLGKRRIFFLNCPTIQRKIVKILMPTLYLYLTCLICLFCVPVYAQLVPTPQKYILQTGECRLERSVGLAFINDNPEESALTAAEVINEAFKDFMQIPTNLEADAKRALVQLIRITPEQAIAYQIPANKVKEGYRLRITTERIIIESTHPAGIFYGANTLAQIIAQNTTSKKLKCLEIIDWADLDNRGISDDISRGQIHTFQYYKKLIRELAHYKQNMLGIYIEDAIEFEHYSEIGSGRAKLSKKEIKDLVTYAQKYFVQLIPIIETLGHQENVLNLKSFQRLAEFPGAMSLCITEPLVYEYLDNIINAIATYFPTPYIHIGGDESFDVGVGRSKALAEQIGLPALHLQHYKKVANICRKYKKKPIIYGDMLLKYPEILSKLDADFTIVDWQYQSATDYPSTLQMQAGKLPYWVSPSVHNNKAVFPILSNALTNIRQLALAGKARGSTGLLTSNWGDMGNESPKELLYFLYAYSGACAWQVEKADAATVHQQFFKHFFKTDSSLGGDCYLMFSNPSIGVTWQEFWRHPLLPTKKTPSWQPSLSFLTKKTVFDWQLPLIKQSIDSLRKQVRDHEESLHAWEITWDMLTFYSKKIALQNRLEAYPNLPTEGKMAYTEQILKDLEAIVIDLQGLQKRYEQTWIRSLKPEGLEPIKVKFKNLIASFMDTKDLILARLPLNVLTSSKWIYPNNRPENPQTEVIFKKNLLLTELPITATMQIIADSYAQVYINGELVDSVYTRNIFSAHLEPNLVKWIDIKSKIGDDENKPLEIMIKAHNYNAGLRKLLPDANINASAGINVVIRLQGNESETLIFSDESWDYKNNEADQNLKRVSIQPYRYEVIAPNFQSNRPSWIER